MAGKLQGDDLIGTALDLDGLFNDPHGLPAIPIAIEICIVRMGFINKHIFLIAAKNRQAKRDSAVMAEGYAGLRWLACPDSVKSRSREMHEIA